MGSPDRNYYLKKECWTEHSSVCKRKFTAQKHLRINTFRSTLFICKKQIVVAQTVPINFLTKYVFCLWEDILFLKHVYIMTPSMWQSMAIKRSVRSFLIKVLKNNLLFCICCFVFTKDPLNDVNNKTSFTSLRKIYSTYIEILHQVNNFFTVRIFFKLHK